MIMKRVCFGLFCVLFAIIATANPTIGQEKAAICAGCHGPQGISINPEWPNLAGQHAAYLAKQLHDYKAGGPRDAAIMTPMVVSLSDKDINDIAEFYASLPLPNSKTSSTDLVRGETLYRQGDLNKHITACIACHGPTGTGNAQAGFPALSKQQPVYTLLQLLAFKNKTRHNDTNAIMQNISAHMDHDDMKAVADYIAQL